MVTAKFSSFSDEKQQRRQELSRQEHDDDERRRQRRRHLRAIREPAVQVCPRSRPSPKIRVAEKVGQKFGEIFGQVDADRRRRRRRRGGGRQEEEEKRQLHHPVKKLHRKCFKGVQSCWELLARHHLQPWVRNSALTTFSV